MNQMTVLLAIWTGLTLIAVLLVLFTRKRRGKSIQNIQLANIVALALAVYATMSSCQLIYQAFTVQELQKLLGGENLPALVLGGIAVIWVSIKEIWKLCVEDNP